MPKGLELFENPFENTNASNMEDELIIKYWTCPQGLNQGMIGKVEFTNLMPNILFGGRGSGKTTILKYLSFDLQEKIYKEDHNKNTLEGFLNTERRFLGIYYRLDAPIFSGFRGKGIEDEKWARIFTYFFELVLGQIYLHMIKKLYQDKAFENTISEKELCKKISISILGKSEQDLDSFDKITSYLEEIQREIEEWKEDITFIKKNLEVKQIPKNRIIFGIPKICSDEIKELKNIHIFYLLDEYENLSENQQIIVNTLLKHRKNPVSFKLGSRYKGLRTKNTTTGEFLKLDSDYRKIDFENTGIDNSSTYGKLLEDIAYNRLKNHRILKTIPNLSIHKYLGKSISSVEEALEVVRNAKTKDKHFQDIKSLLGKSVTENYSYEECVEKIRYSKNPLIEKLNVLLLRRGVKISEVEKKYKKYIQNTKNEETYHNLYNKNRMALLFQLIGDYPPNKKQYSGFQTYRKISSNIVRTFIELCYHAFDKTMFEDIDILIHGKEIPEKIQTSAANTKSNDFFEEISDVPEIGPKLKKFTRSIGGILESLNRNARISEPEQTYFSTDYLKLSENTQKLLNTSVMWSIFQEEESMEPKNPTWAHYRDYLLNHTLAPKFSIAYSKRGRTTITPEIINTLVNGTDVEARDIESKVSKSGPNALNQKTISEFIE